VLYIAESPKKGRGVFTDQIIEPGEIIERCPVIILGEQDVPHIRRTQLNYYYYLWGEDETVGVIVLGYGSLYNHAFEPNAAWRNLYPEKIIEYYAIDRIHSGNEILINYDTDYVIELGFK